MIRYGFINLLILFCAGYTNAQRTISVYEYNYPEDWISVSLTLTSDSAFLWRSVNGFGDVLASGKYSIHGKKLNLLPENAYRFYQDDYQQLITKSILDSCCNVAIAKGGTRKTEYNQIFYNFQTQADSCILNNIACVLTSNKLGKATKWRGFRDTFVFIEFLIKDEGAILFDSKDTHWILTKRR